MCIVKRVYSVIPRAHLPGQLYGWEIVNYNGANLQYRDQFGSWLGTINVFGGGETSHDAGIWKIYNGKDSRTDAKWSRIFGAEIKLSRDWFEGRYVYITSTTRNRIVSEGETDYSDPAPQPSSVSTSKPACGMRSSAMN